MNRILRILDRIFVAYPAETALQDAYSLAMDHPPWQMRIIGFHFQIGGKVGLSVAIPNGEADFENPQMLPHLRSLYGSVEHLAAVLGVREIRFAGILPGILLRNRLIRDAKEMRVIVRAILRAQERIMRFEGMGLDSPVILLGVKSWLGRQLKREFPRSPNQRIFGLDRDLGGLESIRKMLGETKALLIDVSRPHVLDHYRELLWPGLVVLNDVYPGPSRETVALLLARGVPVYHLAGVKGFSFPPFPPPYSGAIPCCAARDVENLQVVIRQLGVSSA